MSPRAVAPADTETPATGARVPVEHRLAGLDRRTFRPATVVIALALLWTVVMPLVNRSLSYDQTTRPGDTFALAAGVTLTPAPGWGVRTGLLAGQRTRSGSPGEAVVLFKGATRFNVTPGTFVGTVDDLLARIERQAVATDKGESLHIDGDKAAIRTEAGQRGRIQSYTTINAQGAVAAFVFGPTSIEVQAVGPEAQIEAYGDDIQAMVQSLTFAPSKETS